MWGVNTIIFLTGLATIDKSTIEAARLDGANGRQVLTYIVLPAMRRFVEFVSSSLWSSRSPGCSVSSM